MVADIRMERLAAEGQSIAWWDGVALFVPGTVPGDRVDVQVTRKRKGYAEGYVVRYRQLSDLRQEPVCLHFDVCGGCQWQMLPYTQQLQMKQQQVADQLQRIGGLGGARIEPILGATPTLYYRNKLEFTFSPRVWKAYGAVPFEGRSSNALAMPNDTTEEPVVGQRLWEALAEGDSELSPAVGFHAPGRFDKVIDIHHCWLQGGESNGLRNAAREIALTHGYSFYDAKTQSGWLRGMMVRTTTLGQTMALFVFAHDDPSARAQFLSEIAHRFLGVTSLLWCINAKVNDTLYDCEMHVYRGQATIEEQLGRLRVVIGPKSFYQTNSRQGERLYNVVRQLAGLKGSETLYDLYTGTGTIGLFLANDCQKVVGIETVPEAIEDAKRNAERNGIANATFYAGDVLELLDADFVAREGRPDVLIADPPRAGMHPKVVEKLLEIAPQRMVYVSCNPATQARDLALLKAAYQVTGVQPVDMFPHTKHVENVVLLERRSF